MQQEGPRAYALKFISGKYQGGEFPLRPGRQIVIGRAQDLDMVLVEDMVSRRHARITATPEALVIEDLGSTNGTFVNGEKVRRATLKEGDRILVGTSILKLVRRTGPATGADEDAARNALARGASRPRDAAMAGRVEEVPMPDLLQLCQTSKRTGVLVVTGDRVGRIHLDGGQVVFAAVEGLSLPPVKAFNRMVGWERGAFELSPPVPGIIPDASLGGSTEGLLMEALRQVDELRRLRAELPTGHARVALTSPLGAPLRDLSPEQLDVLQLVHDLGRVDEILDAGDASDLALSETLAALVRKGYVREVT